MVVGGTKHVVVKAGNVVFVVWVVGNDIIIKGVVVSGLLISSLKCKILVNFLLVFKFLYLRISYTN